MLAGYTLHSPELQYSKDMLDTIVSDTLSFVLLCALCFIGQPIQICFDFIADGVMCRVAVVKSLHVLHHCTVFIFIFL